jgi:hypothetical protein
LINPARIAKLLLKLPYVIKAGPIPPFSVIKDILAKGEFDAGMSGGESWKPLEISMDDYGKIILELQRLKPGLCPIEAPAAVESYRDWVHWRLVQRAGARGSELSQLYARRDLLELERSELLNLNKLDEAENIEVELIRIAGEMSDLLVAVARSKG